MDGETKKQPTAVEELEKKWAESKAKCDTCEDWKDVWEKEGTTITQASSETAAGYLLFVNETLSQYQKFK